MNFFNLCRSTAAVFSISVACLMALPAQAVVLKINSAGLLTGATGVLVAGQRGAYEVDFVDGTCASVFGGCNVSLFQFNNFNAATAAAAALLGQVFVNQSFAAWDTNPGLTSGCTPNAQYCFILTPYRIRQSVLIDLAMVQQDAGNNDSVVYSDINDPAWRTFDTSNHNTVWARWALEVEPPTDRPLPEPGTLVLLGLAGVGLAWTQRRRRAIAAERVQ